MPALPEGLLRGLTGLEVLFIGCYGPETLPGGLLNGLSRLQWVRVHCSGLTSLPEELFVGKSNLKKIHMTWWQADDAARWLLSRLE